MVPAGYPGRRARLRHGLGRRAAGTSSRRIVFAGQLKARGAELHPRLQRRRSRRAQQIPLGPNYQVPFARAVKQATGLPTIAVGLITEADQAEAIVGTGDADLVALARGVLYDPRWPWHAAAHLGASVKVPNQYLRSQPRQFKTLFA